jgi:hypothetical protein
VIAEIVLAHSTSHKLSLQKEQGASPLKSTVASVIVSSQKPLKYSCPKEISQIKGSCLYVGFCCCSNQDNALLPSYEAAVSICPEVDDYHIIYAQ